MAASTALRASVKGMRARMRMRRKSPLHGLRAASLLWVRRLGFGCFLRLLTDINIPRRRRIRAVIGRDFDHACGLFAEILGFVWKFSVVGASAELVGISTARS